jgi:hypothetical protein
MSSAQVCGVGHARNDGVSVDDSLCACQQKNGSMLLTREGSTSKKNNRSNACTTSLVTSLCQSISEKY